MPLREKQIQNQIIEYLNLRGCYVWTQNAGQIPIQSGDKRRFINVGKKGISDIVGIRRRDGRFIALEVKTPKRRKRVTFHQREFLDHILECGGIAGVVTSIEEAEELVK